MDYQDDSRKTEDSSQEEYEFIQETFKDENRKVTGNMIARMAIKGLVFGMTASLSFFALKPWAEKMFHKEETQVMIPSEPEELPEDAGEDSELEEYRDMNEVLQEIGEQASRSMVIISSIEEEDWQEKEPAVSGFIVADNGSELLVMGDNRYVGDDKKVNVQFADQKVSTATLKQLDSCVGYGIYAVDKRKLSNETRNGIQVAKLGTSNGLQQGDTVIALGSPFGYSEAIGFGVVASSNQIHNTTDGEYPLICTDITGTEDGTGILLNIHGEVIGIIDESVVEEGRSLVAGYGISGLKEIIQMLSNGKAVPHIGINGVTVTEEIVEQQGIPAGLYVQSVEADSPAMNGGIQTGDIITKIGTATVDSVQSYQRQLMQLSQEETIYLKGMRQGNGEYVEVTYNITVGSCN